MKTTEQKIADIEVYKRILDLGAALDQKRSAVQEESWLETALRMTELIIEIFKEEDENI